MKRDWRFTWLDDAGFHLVAIYGKTQQAAIESTWDLYEQISKISRPRKMTLEPT